MVDAPGLCGQSGLVGGRDTGSIGGDVVHPPFLFWSFLSDEAFSAGLWVVRLEVQLDFYISNITQARSDINSISRGYSKCLVIFPI